MLQKIIKIPSLKFKDGIYAGVPAEIDVYPDFYHAYDMMNPDTEMAKKAADTFVQKFRKAAEKYFAKQP